jgi:hypothetical protein
MRVRAVIGLAVVGCAALSGAWARPNSVAQASAEAVVARSSQHPLPTPRQPANKAGRTAKASNYFYVQAYQRADTGGATVRLLQASPATGESGYSLAFLGVHSPDDQQVVEIGWMVNQDVNKDLKPHLFVYHFVDGAETCFNGCGFVSTSTSMPAGMEVTPGELKEYMIRYDQGDWWVGYDGSWIGYFPASLWGGRYTRGGIAQMLGSVNSPDPAPCTDMGNGVFGHDQGSATATDFALIDSAATPQLVLGGVTNPSYYDAGDVTSTSLRYGGPGAC